MSHEKRWPSPLLPTIPGTVDGGLAQLVPAFQLGQDFLNRCITPGEQPCQQGLYVSTTQQAGSHPYSIDPPRA